MDDLLSREEVIKALDAEYRCTDKVDDWDGLRVAISIVENLPSAQPKIKTDENNHYKTGYDQGFVDACKMYEKKQPERKTGKWRPIYKDNTVTIYECSECEHRVMADNIDNDNYCYYCGAKMKKKNEVYANE